MNLTKEKEPAVVGATASSAESSASIKDSANSITYRYKNVNIPACAVRAAEGSARVCLALGQLTGIKRYYAELADLNVFLSEIEEVCLDG